MAASATFALKAGVWFRRGRLLMVSPDSRGTACPPSGRNSTYRPVQISGTGSEFGVDGQRHVADSTVRPDGVVVVFPDCQSLASMSKRGEQSLVQQLVTQFAVETLDE